jgi:outer membrane protein
MKFTKYVMIIGVLGLVFVSNSFSQDWFGSYSYNISFPTGDTQDYVDKTSWRGMSLDFRKYVQPNISWGLSFGWHVFHKRTKERITLENGDVSGTQDRYINSFPLMVNAHYYLSEEGEFRPYLGANVGLFRTLQRFEIGLFAWQKNNWVFGFIPEVGFLLPIGEEMNLHVSGKYHFPLEGDTITGNKASVSYIGLNVGLAYYF